jgi:hypothetical protein
METVEPTRAKELQSFTLVSGLTLRCDKPWKRRIVEIKVIS